MVALAPRLTTLALSHNTLRALPDWLATFVALKTLDADHNALAALPAALGSLPRLERLRLDHVRVQTRCRSSARERLERKRREMPVSDRERPTRVEARGDVSASEPRTHTYTVLPW
jgi:hypothetical protein